MQVLRQPIEWDAYTYSGERYLVVDFLLEWCLCGPS